MKQIKFIGFNEKCEFCGNYYSSDYIEIHNEKRCFKKHNETFSDSKLEIKLEEQIVDENVQSVILFISEDNLATDKQQNRLSDIQEESRQAYKESLNYQAESKKPLALKGISQSDKNWLNCPHCKVNVKHKRLTKHLNLCPALRSKKKREKIDERNLRNKHLNRELNVFRETRGEFKANLTFNKKKGLTLSECKYCSLKLNSKNLQKHISTHHPTVYLQVQNSKPKFQTVICSNCGSYYSSSSSNCPQCDNSKTKIKSTAPISKISKCRWCGRQTMYATSVCQFCGDK